MEPRTTQPPFPLLASLALLTALTVATAALTAGVARAVAGASTETIAAVFLAALILWLSLPLALVPVWSLGRLGPAATFGAYVAGTIARLLLIVATCAATILAGKIPAVALIVSVAVLYLPLLTAEAALVGRYLWLKDSLPPAHGPAAPATEASA